MVLNVKKTRLWCFAAEKATNLTCEKLFTYKKWSRAAATTTKLFQEKKSVILPTIELAADVSHLSSSIHLFIHALNDKNSRKIDILFPKMNKLWIEPLLNSTLTWVLIDLNQQKSLGPEQNPADYSAGNGITGKKPGRKFPPIVFYTLQSLHRRRGLDINLIK